MGSSKTPTIIYYDQQGKVRAVGAEAIYEGIEAGSKPNGIHRFPMTFIHLGSNSIFVPNQPPVPATSLLSPETRRLGRLPLPMCPSKKRIPTDVLCRLL